MRHIAEIMTVMSIVPDAVMPIKLVDMVNAFERVMRHELTAERTIMIGTVVDIVLTAAVMAMVTIVHIAIVTIV